jgi:hypothetical protein
VTRLTSSVATAVLAFAAFAGSGLGSAAMACISCNYVPEVVNTPVSPGPKKAKPSKPSAAVKRPVQKKVVKRPPAVQEPAATAKAPDSAADDGKTTAVEGQTGAESAGDTTAALSGDDAAANEPAPEAQSGGCKKFSATAGTTVTVPCE